MDVVVREIWVIGQVTRVWITLTNVATVAPLFGDRHGAEVRIRPVHQGDLVCLPDPKVWLWTEVVCALGGGREQDALS